MIEVKRGRYMWDFRIGKRRPFWTPWLSPGSTQVIPTPGFPLLSLRVVAGV